MEKIVLVGAGGHCISVLDAINCGCEYEVVAITDMPDQVGRAVGQLSVTHGDEALASLFESGIKSAAITIGGIGDTRLREILYKKLKEIGFTLPIISDPSAVVSKTAIIEEGVFIGKNSVVNSCSIIEKMAIINTASVIEHECMVGQFASIAPGTVLSGRVKVGAHTHIGTNSTVIENITIGSNSLIGAGSVVVKDIVDHSKAFGNPCKEVGKW